VLSVLLAKDRKDGELCKWFWEVRILISSRRQMISEPRNMPNNGSINALYIWG
jgi:hypothetical protein